jgi:hypothetical protein
MEAEGAFHELHIRKQHDARFKLLCAEIIDTSAKRVPQKRLDPVLQLPPRHWQLNGSHDGLKVQPEGILLLIDAIDDI